MRSANSVQSLPGRHRQWRFTLCQPTKSGLWRGLRRRCYQTAPKSIKVRQRLRPSGLERTDGFHRESGSRRNRPKDRHGAFRGGGDGADAGGERVGAPHALEPRTSGTAFRQRLRTDGAPAAIPTGSLRSQGDGHADRPAKPADLEPADSGSAAQPVAGGAGLYGHDQPGPGRAYRSGFRAIWTVRRGVHHGAAAGWWN